MLKIEVKGIEYFNEETQSFENIKPQTLVLEHSLVSISKWEAKWHVPFLGNGKEENKTSEMILDYIRCMTISQNVDPLVYYALTTDQMKQINDYISNPMTATWFNDSRKNSPNREIITSELIYYWMITFNIPVEFQKWHINRLLTLIRVCNIKNAPPSKMSKNEILARNHALNEARKKQLHTNG